MSARAGIAIARDRSSSSSGTSRPSGAVAAANGKQVIMFGARNQTHEAQAGSGYAAYIGGAIGVSTDEQGEWWGSKGLGTVPHALIAVYGGDTTVATLKFDEYINRSSDVVGH